MATPTQRATISMAWLGDACETYLDQAISRGDTDACDACEVQQAVTPKGLTIRRKAGELSVGASFYPEEALDAGDVHLTVDVAWPAGTSKLPIVKRKKVSPDCETPQQTTVRDFPGIAMLLGNSLHTERHLSVVR